MAWYRIQFFSRLELRAFILTVCTNTPFHGANFKYSLFWGKLFSGGLKLTIAIKSDVVDVVGTSNISY